MSLPRIWVFPGNRPGDDSQVYALAEELGLPFETRKLKFNWLSLLDGRLLSASALSVERGIRERTLIPPWPDLIILVGRRAVPVARWVQQQSGGRTRLVLIGHPRVPDRLFDLIFTTRQYRTPTGPSVRLLPVAMSRYRDPPKAKTEEQAWLDALPRPHLLLMLGGRTRHWQMKPSDLAAKARTLAERAARSGGSLIVTRSARTPDAVLDAIESELELSDCKWRVVRCEFPRFSLLLSDADELFPTADSISMVSESIITGKPVGIVPANMSWAGLLALGSGTGARSNTARDLRRFWSFLFDEKIAGTMDDPVAANVPNPVIEAAAEVRSLLERSLGKLPG